jgi:hypothetical protein
MATIIAADDERLLVELTIPAVKGRKEFTVKLPRYDSIDPDEYVAMLAKIAAVETDTTLTPYVKQREATLTMLRGFVTNTQAASLEKLTLAQLEHLRLLWSEGSSVSLGELLASDTTSTGNTEAQSNMTSSTFSESGEGTSDAA